MLIDTNVWGELTRRAPDRTVLAFVAENGDRLHLSTIVLAEMEFGIAQAPDPIRRERLVRFRYDALTRCADRMLKPDRTVAAIWGRLKAELESSGKPIADMDLLIASQAIAANLPLVTRNVSHMTRTGAFIINPWQP